MKSRNPLEFLFVLWGFLCSSVGCCYCYGLGSGSGFIKAKSNISSDFSLDALHATPVRPSLDALHAHSINNHSNSCANPPHTQFHK